MADNLDWIRVDLAPTAECDEDGCEWHCSGWGWTARDVTNAAKKHARQYPGHAVIVDRVNRAVYSTPAEVSSDV